ncbi:aquaporin, partial [Empedobacter sp.]
MKNYAAEFFGTFWLVFGGCGSAIFAAGIPELGIGYAGVALAFGLTVLTMAYAVGHISGGHFNPAVSFGLFAGGRFDGKQLIPYIISQVLGAIAAAGVLYLISSGNSDFAIDNTKAGAFASNGYGAFSPHGYSMLSAFLIEFVLTAFF